MQRMRSSEESDGGFPIREGRRASETDSSKCCLGSDASRTSAEYNILECFSSNSAMPGKHLICESSQRNSFEVHSVTSLDEYTRYAESMRSVFDERLKIEERLIGEGDSFTVPGFCVICSSEVDFHVDYYASANTKNMNGQRIPNWRERLVCTKCGLINRCRSVIHLIQKILPAFLAPSIFIAEQTTPIYSWLVKHYPKVIGSEFLGEEIPLGTQRSDGIRNENLTALTFPDDSFDCVMSFDVFEHIPDYQKAFKQCWRILKPGGVFMFTVPFNCDSQYTIIRAKYSPDGSVEHLLPPQYHGDPLNGTKGCLCYQVFGWDIIQNLEGIGFNGASAYFFWSRELGYLGQNQIIFLASKKQPEKQKNDIITGARKVSGRKIAVSIVIPVFNKLSYTQKCLQAIKRNSPADTYELIVVDNASTDGTREYLGSLEGTVQTITNTENAGFTLACNQGARIARGEYVLFLNNDTEPQPTWLESMVALAESDPAIGIVGSKLVYPDGKLQEAGGIIFNDGSGWNYGRFGDPDDPTFNYVREVDYVSGASLLIRNSLLRQLNYFDEQYSPGYYEDTDLCFGARSLGYKVMYCPFSVVVHHEGVSSGNDLSQGMKRHQTSNRGKFAAKWAKVLHSQYALDSRNVVPASQRGTKENILVIDPFLPMFDRASGSLRLFHILSLMKKQGHHLTFIARNGEGQEKYADLLRRMGVEVYATDPDLLRQMGYHVRARKIDLRSILKSRHYQFAYLSFYSLALQYLPGIRKFSPQTKILIDSVDIHFVRERRQAELNNDEALLERSKVTRNDELFIYSAADAIITVTEQDWDHIRQYLSGKEHFIIPNIHATSEDPPKADERSGLLFIGNFNHPPNIDAVTYFLKDIFPKVEKRLPGITLTIVGNNPPKDFLTLKQKNVRVTGYVESTEPYLKKARVSIAPLRYGAGMKGKIGEAMAYGLPVVTTSIGAEGIGLITGKTAFVSDSAHEFADHIITLCTNDDTWHSVASSARQMILDNYSPKKVNILIEDMLRKANTLNPLEIGGGVPAHRTKADKPIQKGLVSIIVLTFNQVKYTKECLESIREHTREAHEIIFVDNGSTDGTVKWLRKLAKNNSHYKLIENKKNLGFSKGCNQGIEASSGEYILLLNNDVVVTESWLGGMLECLDSSPDIGIVGPMTNSISGPQRVPLVGYISVDGLAAYARSFRERNRHRRLPQRRVVGFCMLLKYRLIDDVGLLDESFGTGNFEDDDLCLRASLAGYRNMIAGDVFIHHYGSRTFIGNRIDYSSSLNGNWKIFLEKWSGGDVARRFGKTLLIENAVSRAEDFYRQGQMEKATASMLEAIKQSPDDRSLYFNLAEMLIDAKRYEDALGLLESMPKGDTDARQLALLGSCEEGLGRDDKAQDYADRALSVEPTNVQALNTKGVLAYKKGEKGLSESLFGKAIDSNPSHGESYTNLGSLKWGEGERAEGLNLFERGFILSPAVADVVTAYYSAAADSGEFGRAESAFREAQALFPNDKKITFLLISLLIKQENYQLAISEIEQAMMRFGVDEGILSAALVIRAKTGPQGIQSGNTRRSLSVCMIVKNEELNLTRCLMSVKPVTDEIIVVDTGSTDQTKAIATALGAKVFDFPWTEDFSEARNYSLSKASGDWILVLDADEVISPLDHAALRSLVQNGDKRFAYIMTTRNYTFQVASQNWTGNDGKYLQEEAGNGWLPSPKVRLFANDKRIRFANPVHELVETSLKQSGIRIKNCNIPVHHYGRLRQDHVAAKGEEYYRLGKKKVLGTKGGYHALKELAIQATELGRYEEAIALWEDLIKLNPKDAVAYLNLGYAHMKLGRCDRGLICSRKALELEPNSKEAGLNYAGCELIIGDVKKAISVLDQLLQKNPGYPPALARLAAAHIIDGQREEGLQCLKRLKRLRFDCADALSEQARAFLFQNRIDQAMVLLEAGIATNNVNADTRDLLAECQRQREDRFHTERVGSSSVLAGERLPEQLV